MPTSKTCTHALYALSAALALAACALPTRLAGLSGGGEGTDSGDSIPIDSDANPVSADEAGSPVTLTREPVRRSNARPHEAPLAPIPRHGRRSADVSGRIVDLCPGIPGVLDAEPALW